MFVKTICIPSVSAPKLKSALGFDFSIDIAFLKCIKNYQPFCRLVFYNWGIAYVLMRWISSEKITVVMSRNTRNPKKFI